MHADEAMAPAPEVMHPTPASLLERLRQPADSASWTRFVQLYSPLLYHWTRRLGLSPEDASDLVQDVFTVLVQKLPEFTYDRQKRFRGWLWTITLNKLRENRRRWTLPTQEASDSLLESQAAAGEDFFAEAEYREFLLNRALQLLQTDFQPTTWQAFWEHVSNGRPAPEVAAELGISIGAVYAAKLRVLGRLREELCGLLD